MRRLTLLWLSGSAAALLWQGQDPERPAPAPVPPPAAAVPQAPPKPERPSLDGVYELRRRVLGGIEHPHPGRGYVAFTKRHMLLCMTAPGTDPKQPLLRAAVRTWFTKQDLVETDVKLGFYTDAKGELHIDKPGTTEVRRVDVERGLVRIHQDDHSYLEFERIE